MLTVPPKSRVRASLFPLCVMWLGLVCAAQEARPVMLEGGDQQRPVVTEVPSAQLPLQFRERAQVSVSQVPPSMRYKELRQRVTPRIVLPDLDATPYREEDKRAHTHGERKVRGGVMRPVNITPEKDGEWTEPEPGVRVWRVEIQSPHAEATKLRFADVSLSETSELFLTGGGLTQHFAGRDAKVLQGSYSTLFRSETVALEVLQHVEQGQYPEDSLQISAFGHVYRGDAKDSNQDSAGACELDASCHPEWGDTAKSVGLISYVLGQYIYFCSGALINNNSNDFSPLILTAQHCGLNSSTAPGASMEWKYASATCGGPGVHGLPSNIGGFVATSDDSDSTLLWLYDDSFLPAIVQLTWAGWSLNDQSGTVTAIHHPMESYRRISFGDLTASDPDSTDFHKVIFQSGITEPGSSGSPLFNSNHLIIGQLYGGFSSCDNPHGPDYYGKLAISYPHFVDSNGNNYLELGLPDDALGDIGSREKAAPLSLGKIDNLVLRVGHDDWFRITPQPYYRVQLQIEPTRGATGLGYEVFRNDESQPVFKGTWVDRTDIQATGVDDVFYVRVFLQIVPRSHYAIAFRTAPPPDPFVTSVPPPTYLVTVADEKFTGTVGAGHYVGSAWFEYSNSADLSDAQSSPRVDYTQDTTITFVPASLPENTTFYYRAVATNGLTTVRGAIVALHTFSGNLTVSPNRSLIFPDQLSDTSSGPLSITLTNTGQLPLSIGSVRLRSVATDFVLDPSSCPSSLSASQSCSVMVVFHPTHPGVFEEPGFYAVDISTSGGSTSISLQGTGSGAIAFLSFQGGLVTQYYYLPTPAQGYSPPRTVTLTNQGNMPMDLSAMQLTGSGFIQTNNCPASLPARANCIFSITAHPPSAGHFNALLSLGGSIYGATTLNLLVDAFELTLNVKRATRPHRGSGGISAAQTATSKVTVLPSVAANATAAISCGGMPSGMTCQVQPATVDLSNGGQDVDVIVTQAARSQRVVSNSARASRLGGALTTTASRDVNVTVTATVNGAVRSIQVPVSFAQ